MDTICLTWGYRSVFLRIQSFLFVIPRLLIDNYAYGWLGKSRCFHFESQPARNVLKRGCSITTLRNFGKSAKFPDKLDVYSWWTEEGELMFREGMELSSQIVLSGLSAIRPPINHDNKLLDTSFFQRKPQACPDWTYRGEFLPILIYRSEIWALIKGDKNE